MASTSSKQVTFRGGAHNVSIAEAIYSVRECAWVLKRPKIYRILRSHVAPYKVAYNVPLNYYYLNRLQAILVTCDFEMHCREMWCSIKMRMKMKIKSRRSYNAYMICTSSTQPNLLLNAFWHKPPPTLTSFVLKCSRNECCIYFIWWGNFGLTLILLFRINAIHRTHRCRASRQLPANVWEIRAIAVNHRRSMLHRYHCMSWANLLWPLVVVVATRPTMLTIVAWCWSCGCYYCRCHRLKRMLPFYKWLSLHSTFRLVAVVPAVVWGIPYYSKMAAYYERSHNHLVFSVLSLAYVARHTPGIQYQERLQ